MTTTEYARMRWHVHQFKHGCYRHPNCPASNALYRAYLQAIQQAADGHRNRAPRMVRRSRRACRIPADSAEAVRRETREEVRYAARRKAAAVATESAELAHDAGPKARPLAVEPGDGSANAIMQAAANESAAAVVIGRTSRTRLGRLLPGSVPRQITSHSPAPVLLA